MNLLVFSEENIAHYGNTEGALMEARRLNPDAILLVGITSLDTLELACRLKIQDSEKKMLVGIIECVDELPRLKLFTRLRSSCEELRLRPKSSSRRFVIDVRGREILSGDTRSVCSPTELRLLMLFLRYPEIVFSRSELWRRISSNYETVPPRIIDVLVHRIRAKIETQRHEPAHLRTVRDVGYIFQHNSDVFIDRLTHDPVFSWPCGAGGARTS